MHIFYYVGGKFGEVMGVSPDARLRGIGRWTKASGVVSVANAGAECASNANNECRQDTVRTSGGA